MGRSTTVWPSLFPYARLTAGSRASAFEISLVVVITSGRVAHPFSIFLLDGGSRLDHTTQVRQRGVIGFVLLFRVPDPSSAAAERVWVLVFPRLHGQQTHSDLRARASAFHHVQLLSVRTIPAFGSCQNNFCPETRRGPRPLRFQDLKSDSPARESLPFCIRTLRRRDTRGSGPGLPAASAPTEIFRFLLSIPEIFGKGNSSRNRRQDCFFVVFALVLGETLSSACRASFK